MKILLVCDKFPPEGTTVGTLVGELARAFALGGDTPGIFTTHISNPDSGTIGKEDFYGVPVFRVPKPDAAPFLRAYVTLYNPKTVKLFTQVLKEFRPEIVHFNTIHQFLGYPLIAAAKSFGAQTILTHHDVMAFHYGKLIEFISPTDYSIPDKFNYRVHWWRQARRFGFYYNPIRNLMIKWFLKKVDRLLAVSSALQEALRQNGISPVSVLHNGIEKDRWTVEAKSVDDFKNRLGLNAKKIVFFGGRINRMKGAEQLLAAFRKVADEVPEARLMIVGKESDYTAKLKSLADAGGFGSKIIVTGWLAGSDLAAAYRGSEVVAVPSICFDSFPTTLLEAMACKKPVVGTCFGGSREIIVDGKTGYIVNPCDKADLAKKIIAFLKDPQKAMAFGEAGYQRLCAEFTLDRQVEKLLAVYRQMLADTDTRSKDSRSSA